jgi:hypothetical protein
MSTDHETDAPAEKPRRVTQGEIIMRLLERGSSQSSSVTIARNAKGDVQFEVVIRTDPDNGIATPAEAEAIAVEITERLREKYPFVGVAPTAKGA